jgi:hydrogenase expression/formation protein HypE
VGKLATKELQKLIDCIRKDERVLVPPTIGFDAGVHRLGDQYMVVATDPCTGVPEEWFGWLLINYAASDVALSGANPQFCTIALLGPCQTKQEVFQRIMQQTCKAAEELGIIIVRGHTGMYDSLKDTLGVCTAYGTIKPEKLITSGGAKAGDLILCTKPLGLEAITNFSLVHQQLATKIFGANQQQEYAKMVLMQSCVKEALALAQVEGVHAMHDATEGGFVLALNELAEASKLGLKILWENIPVPTEVSALKKHFGLNDQQVLSMSSTGTILAAVTPQAKQKASETLRKLGLSASYIGEFTEDKSRTLIKNEKTVTLPNVADDPYTMMLATS